MMPSDSSLLQISPVGIPSEWISVSRRSHCFPKRLISGGNLPGLLGAKFKQFIVGLQTQKENKGLARHGLCVLLETLNGCTMMHLSSIVFRSRVQTRHCHHELHIEKHTGSKLHLMKQKIVDFPGPMPFRLQLSHLKLHVLTEFIQTEQMGTSINLLQAREFHI